MLAFVLTLEVVNIEKCSAFAENFTWEQSNIFPPRVNLTLIPHTTGLSSALQVCMQYEVGYVWYDWACKFNPQCPYRLSWLTKSVLHQPRSLLLCSQFTLHMIQTCLQKKNATMKFSSRVYKTFTFASWSYKRKLYQNLYKTICTILL